MKCYACNAVAVGLARPAGALNPAPACARHEWKDLGFDARPYVTPDEEDRAEVARLDQVEISTRAEAAIENRLRDAVDEMAGYRCSECGRPVQGDAVTVADCSMHPLAIVLAVSR